MSNEIASLESRIAVLESQVRNRRFERVAFFVTSAAFICILTTQTSFAKPEPAQRTLRVRELTVEDDKGNARVVISGKLPKMAEAKYTGAEASGIFLFDPAGTMRLSMASPQIEPKGLGRRSEGDVGLLIFDPKGGERGGYGLLKDGTGVCTLDSVKGREAIGMVAWSNGTSALGLWSDVPEYNTPIWLSVRPNGQPSLFMRDKDKKSRLFLGVTDKGGTAMQFLDAKEAEALKLGANKDGRATTRLGADDDDLETGYGKPGGS
jgi:hypothetical protein